MNARLKKAGGLKDLKKIGFITPSSNTALEPLTQLMTHQISDRVSTHFSRVQVRTLTLDANDVNQFETSKMAEAASLLGDAAVDVILWNGTSGAWSGKGFEADKDICAAITGTVGVPASTSSLAQLEVLAQYGIQKFALATPYVQAPARQMARTYESAGFEVVKEARLDITKNQVIGGTSFDTIKQLLRDADSPDAECIVVGCTNLAAAAVLDDMEHELGKPIFDSIAVTLWQALQMAGISNPLHGWGQLLRDHEVLAELDTILAELLVATSASRTTIRLDIPELNIGVDDVYAEATAPGVASLRLDSSLNQRSLATVQWLDRHRDLLIQEDCINAQVPPPKALMGVYGVKAQVLGPLVWRNQLVGWISVHHLPDTRPWSDRDIEAMRAAMDKARSLLERSGWV
ncbi:GAF domain-containing protein [Castellaniella sp. S9]|uniref:aspartate racemase/maleate isomerase family protein n=1 Tax=Castellaniella sp. S9 TaxID=2993652 RepID=UPI0022B4C771|nr:GAF domain-containing protein [Castellaniella sp. S9]